MAELECHELIVARLAVFQLVIPVRVVLRLEITDQLVEIVFRFDDPLHAVAVGWRQTDSLAVDQAAGGVIGSFGGQTEKTFD